jgi:Escherichia/Staphylococcus phage prohead protease
VADRLVGHAIVTNSRSTDLGGFIEIIRPSAITRALAANTDIRALANHNTDHVLGRTRAGTLQLQATPKGLEATIHTPDTTMGRDTATSVARGDVSGMSFAFRVPEGGDVWHRDGDTIVREVVDMRIKEVSIVAFPAYPDTSIAVAHRSARGATGRHSRKFWEDLHRQRLA